MRFESRFLVLAMVTVCSAQLGLSAEKKITQADLPPAVLKTAQQQSQGATVKGYTRDHENGQDEFEVEMIVSGHSKDVSIGKDGRLLEVEEQVEIERLPGAVLSGLKAKAGSGSITKVESIDKGGKVVAYEAQVKNAGKHSEIQVGPDGKPLDHEE